MPRRTGSVRRAWTVCLHATRQPCLSIVRDAAVPQACVAVDPASGTAAPPTVCEQVRRTPLASSYLERTARIYRRDDRTDALPRALACTLSSPHRGSRGRNRAAPQAFDPGMAPATALCTVGARPRVQLSPRPHADRQSRTLIARIRGTLRAARHARRRSRHGGDLRRHSSEDHRSVSTRGGYGSSTRLVSGLRYCARRSRRRKDSSFRATPLPDPAYARTLRGDYYVGTDFNALVFSRTDFEVIDIRRPFRCRSRSADGSSPPRSIRRSRFDGPGQLRPRYSETYLLRVTHGSRRAAVGRRALPAR